MDSPDAGATAAMDPTTTRKAKRRIFIDWAPLQESESKDRSRKGCRCSRGTYSRPLSKERGSSPTGARSVAGGANEERNHNGDGDERDDDPLEDLHASGRRLIRHLAVDAVERLELSQDRRVPGFEMKAPGCEAVDPRQVLVPDERQRVVDSLEENRAVHLELGDARRVRLETARQPKATPGLPGKRLVRLVESEIELLVEHPAFQKLGVRERQHS